MLRPLLRRVVPAPIRLRIAIARRAARDARRRPRFATRRGVATPGVPRFAAYDRPLIVYPGQEEWGRAKVANVRLMAEAIDGVVIGPGETFSLWRLVGRPTPRAGYGVAAAIRDGALVGEVGGATCLLATVLYNIGLLGALAIDERHHHSVDSYGRHRYFELGRDAAIEYGYRDLRMTNRRGAPLTLRVEVTERRVGAWLDCAGPPPPDAAIEVSDPEWRVDRAGWVMAVRTTRYAPGEVAEDLGWSRYLAPWREDSTATPRPEYMDRQRSATSKGR